VEAGESSKEVLIALAEHVIKRRQRLTPASLESDAPMEPDPAGDMRITAAGGTAIRLDELDLRTEHASPSRFGWGRRA
jgi:hypothetical protein